MQVSRELLEHVREDARGDRSRYKRENSLSVLGCGWGDVSAPKIVSVQERRGNDSLLIRFLSPDEEP